MIRYIHSLIFLSLILPVIGQDIGIRNFNATSYDHYVLVSWSTDSGYTCSNLVLRHSGDSIVFNEIFNVPGVCGSLQEAKSYTYIHSSPLPDQVNYYQLNYTGNTKGYFTSTFFRKNEMYLVFPNPVYNHSSIFLSNFPIEYTFEVLDLSGNKIKIINGYHTHIFIESTWFQSGIYIFQLRFEDRIFSGKFIIK